MSEFSARNAVVRAFLQTLPELQTEWVGTDAYFTLMHNPQYLGAVVLKADLIENQHWSAIVSRCMESIVPRRLRIQLVHEKIE
jgi:hypothetical protein